VRAFNPRRKRYDERVAQKTARARIGQAVRQLGVQGFVDLVDDHLRLRPALLRFAEPVRGLLDPAEALAALVARGEATMEVEATEPEGEGAEPSVDEDVVDEESPEVE
jgi:chromosome partition protein MukE